MENININDENIINNNGVWTYNHEMILKKWADKALIFKLMHEKSYKKYWCLNAWFQIPVIIISSVCGSGNFSLSSIEDNLKTLFIFIIGGLNIFTAIISSIASYIGVAKKMEGHRYATLAWDKFHRKIEIELNKDRKERNNVLEFTKNISNDYNTLIENSPIISEHILRLFIRLIENGEIEENIDDMCLCFYDYICFPFGCGVPKCCYKRKKHINPQIKEICSRINIMEIIGYTPIEINIDDKKNIDITKNEYDIYNIT
jgi:hypothetical protein